MMMWYSGEEDAILLAVAKPSPLLAPITHLVLGTESCELGEPENATAYQ